MTGLELRERRHAAGLTQAELARRVKMTVLTVKRWESGARRVPGWVEVIWELVARADFGKEGAE